jgi:hypothetical protein
MGFEKRVLNVIGEVTDTAAYFFNGTLFLASQDSAEAVRVFNALYEQITPAIAFGKAGPSETYYDFL